MLVEAIGKHSEFSIGPLPSNPPILSPSLKHVPPLAIFFPQLNQFLNQLPISDSNSKSGLIFHFSLRLLMG